MREPLKSLGSASWKNGSKHPLSSRLETTTKKKSSKYVKSAMLGKDDHVITPAPLQSPIRLLDNDELMANIFGNYDDNEHPNNIQSMADDSAALNVGNYSCESSRQGMVRLNNKKQSQKKTRGHNKPQFATHFLEKMVFTKSGAAVAPKGKISLYSRFIARVATDPFVLPINAKDFRVLRKLGLVEKAWSIVKATIDWSYDDTQEKEVRIKQTVEKKLNYRWRKFKYHLCKQFYLPYVGEAQRFECDDPRADVDQYKLLVNIWDEDGYMEKRSKVGVMNRQARTAFATSGSMTFAQMRYEWEMEHPDQVLDRCTFFVLSHSKKSKDGELPKAVNEATQKHFDMIDALEQREIEAGNEVTPALRDHIFAEIFGPKKNNEVRGYGVGVEWQDVPRIVTKKSGFIHQVHELQASLAESNDNLIEAQVAAEQAREEVHNLKEANALKDQQMEEELNLIRNQLEILSPLAGILTGRVQSIDGNSLQSLITLLTNVGGKQLSCDINGCSTMQQPQGQL